MLFAGEGDRLTVAPFTAWQETQPARLILRRPYPLTHSLLRWSQHHHVIAAHEGRIRDAMVALAFRRVRNGNPTPSVLGEAGSAQSCQGHGRRR